MKRLAILLIVLMLTMTGCQQCAKDFGGTVTIELPKNTKLVNITWKDKNLWYLTKPMTNKDSAETYSFSESSQFGLANGTVIVKEIKE